MDKRKSGKVEGGARVVITSGVLSESEREALSLKKIS